VALRIPIRWKFVLEIGVPLLIVYVAVIAIAYTGLRGIAYRTVEDLMSRVAIHQATLFDGKLSTVEQVAHSTAAFLETHEDVTTEEQFTLLRRNIQQNPLIYGACIAYEPGAFDPAKARFAPYVCRDKEVPGGLRYIDLSTAYDYRSGRWEWYTLPATLGAAVWTEPYFDEGAGNVIMCTFSVPFRRSGKLVGMATVDVKLEDLQQSVGGMDLEGSQFVITSRRGTFISASDPSLIMRETVGGVAERLGRPDLAALGERLAAGERGVTRVGAFPTEPEPSYVFFAPIPATGWSFAAAVPVRSVMEPVWRRLMQFGVVMLLGLVLILTLLVMSAFRITAPIAQLAGAVRQVSAGNLDTHVNIASRDELGELGAAFNTMTRELRSHVDALARATAARQVVENELRVARDIQTSLLPRTFPPYPDRPEFDLHATNVPARQVGGDFYDFFFATDDVLTVVVADVVGKGVPAALFMAVARTVIRNLAMAGLSPGAILTRANELLNQDNDRYLFVTVFLGHYHTATGRLVYANAAHPHPYRLDGTGHVTCFGDATGTLLGVIEGETFGEREVRLDVGERVVIFTDGVPDARSPDDAFFGDDRLRELIGAHASEPVERFCTRIAETVDAFEHHQRKDDVTLVVLHRNR
jgi:sigma-B regulation protein RsbU (phosphoserine phosphatase)